VAWPGDSAAVFAATDDGEVFRYTNLKTHTGEQSSATGDERQLGTAAAAVHVLTVSADGVCESEAWSIDRRDRNWQPADPALRERGIGWSTRRERRGEGDAKGDAKGETKVEAKADAKAETNAETETVEDRPNSG
jgi:hypothetical protein